VKWAKSLENFEGEPLGNSSVVQQWLEQQEFDFEGMACPPQLLCRACDHYCRNG